MSTAPCATREGVGARMQDGDDFEIKSKYHRIRLSCLFNSNIEFARCYSELFSFYISLNCLLVKDSADIMTRDLFTVRKVAIAKTC